MHAFRANRGAVFGVLEFIKRKAREIAEGIRDRFGELINKPAPKPVPVQQKSKPAQTRDDGFQKWLAERKAPPCLMCKSTTTIYVGGQFGPVIHCNSCGSTDGVPPAPPMGTCCENFLPQMVSGQIRCGNCGKQSGGTPAIVGATFKQLAAHQSRSGFGNGRYGRFG